MFCLLYFFSVWNNKLFGEKLVHKIIIVGGIFYISNYKILSDLIKMIVCTCC